MVKIAWGAGHGLHTPGKRTPNDEREWSFNNKVVLAGMLYLATRYEGVQQLRVDDPSGRIDTPLAARTNQANYFKADLYVSCHHNATAGVWGDHGGVETFTHPQSSTASKDIAAIIHPKVVKAMGLADRGLKTANYHDLRESDMPAVLVEGGFMDSRIDIKKMRDDKVLKAQGEAIGKGIAEYFGLKLKGTSKPTEVKGVVKVEYKKDASAGKSLIKGQEFIVKKDLSDGTYPERPLTRAEFWETLRRYDELKVE